MALKSHLKSLQLIAPRENAELLHLRWLFCNHLGDEAVGDMENEFLWRQVGRVGKSAIAKRGVDGFIKISGIDAAFISSFSLFPSRWNKKLLRWNLSSTSDGIFSLCVLLDSVFKRGQPRQIPCVFLSQHNIYWRTAKTLIHFIN